MKKMLAAALAVIMSICLLALPMNAQSGLNENEEKLLEYVEKEFETTQDGVFVKLPADMVAKATAYLSTDGLEISDAQFAAAEVQIIAIQDFIRTNLTVADGATELKLEDVSGDVYDGLLNIYTKLAEALNATVIIDENANRIVAQSNDVPNAVLVILEGNREVGAGIDMTVVSVLGTVAVLSILAAAYFVTRKGTKNVNA